MYRYKFSLAARKKLIRLVKHNPKVAKAIMRKIKWLSEHADDIAQHDATYDRIKRL